MQGLRPLRDPAEPRVRRDAAARPADHLRGRGRLLAARHEPRHRCCSSIRAPAEPHRRRRGRGLRLLPPQRADARAADALVLRHLQPAARRRCRTGCPTTTARRSSRSSRSASARPPISARTCARACAPSRRARPRRRARSATATSAPMRYVLMPQAMRNALPALVNHSVSLFKNSSLAMAIGVAELTHAVQGGREPELPHLRDLPDRDGRLPRLLARSSWRSAPALERRAAHGGSALSHDRRHRRRSSATTGCCC